MPLDSTYLLMICFPTNQSYKLKQRGNSETCCCNHERLMNRSRRDRIGTTNEAKSTSSHSSSFSSIPAVVEARVSVCGGWVGAAWAASSSSVPMSKRNLGRHVLRKYHLSFPRFSYYGRLVCNNVC